MKQRIDGAPKPPTEGTKEANVLPERGLSSGADFEPKPKLAPEQLARVEDFLRTEGVIQEVANPKNGEKVKVIDLGRMADDQTIVSKAFNNRVEKDGKMFNFSKRDTLFQLLGGEVGITKEQYERGDFSSKPFLYIPESIDAATSMMPIKNTEFHAGIWELSNTNNSFQKHPTQERVESEISDIEVRCSALIFHPKYGDAFRDEKGNLVIRDAETRKYKPFSWTALRGYGITDSLILGRSDNRDENRSIQEALRAHLPHLVERGALSPERDIRGLSIGHVTGEEKDFDRRVSNPRYVMMNGVRHYLNRDGVQGGFLVRRLTDKLGALVDAETNKVTLTFMLLNRSEISKKENAQYPEAGAAQSQPRAFVPESFAQPKRMHESDARYRARVYVVEEALQTFLRTAQSAGKFVGWIRKEDPLARTTFGDALRFVAETEGGQDAFAHLAAQFGSDEQTTQTIIASYGGLMRAADEAEDFVHENIACEKEECEEMALRVRHNILSKAQQLLTSSIRSPDVSKIAEKFSLFSVGGALFVGIFRALKESKNEVSLEDIRSASFEQITALDLSKEDRKEMQEIWESQYGKKEYEPRFREDLRRGFDESLTAGTVTYFLYRHEGHIISFSRSEVVGERDNLLVKHRGSLMTHPGYAGGAVGLVFFKKVLALDRQGSILEAECDADPEKTPVMLKYFEEYGYIATGYREDKADTANDEEKGEPTLVLEQRDGEIFHTKGLSQQEIRSYAHADLREEGMHFVRYEGASFPFSTYFSDEYAMTRFFRDSVQGKPVYYAAFEKRRLR